jgi:hypothetical protein
MSGCVLQPYCSENDATVKGKPAPVSPARAQEQTFFASFLQKRSACLLFFYQN